MDQKMDQKIKKALESQAIDEKVEQFLESGGKIEAIEIGVIRSTPNVSQNEYHSKMKAVDLEKKLIKEREL